MANNATGYSTLQVAREIGVHRSTLLRWLQSGEIPEPRRIIGGGQDVRVWSPRDLSRAQRLKADRYRRARVPGRGRGKKSATERLSP
jgi:DNA-binding transcriptional MerR regulator